MTGHCQKCGTYRERLQKDHVIPKWNGGSDDLSNRQFLCANHTEKARKAIAAGVAKHERSAEHCAALSAAGFTREAAKRQARIDLNRAVGG